MTAMMMGSAMRNLCNQDNAPEPLYDIGDVVYWYETHGIFNRHTEGYAGFITRREYEPRGFFADDALECEWLYTIIIQSEYDEVAARADEFIAAYGKWEFLVPKHYLRERDIEGLYQRE